MHTLLMIIVIIAASYFLVRLANLAKIPSVVALILMGIALGFPYIEGPLIEPHSDVIMLLGDIGLVLLMFLAGLESSWEQLYKEKFDAVVIAIAGVVLPLGVGFGVFLLLGFSWKVSLVIGIAMSISAEATRAKVLYELGKLKTRLGSALIGAGIIDDLIGLSLFVIIAYVLKHGGAWGEILVLAAIAAFFVGIVIRKLVGRNKILDILEKILNFGIIPFFFIEMGLNFDLHSLILHPWLLALIVFIAFAGKLGSAFILKPVLDFRWRQLHLVGWAMNSRGALELALALVAFRLELINNELYSSLVIMALVTTLAFPFIVCHMIKKESKVMD